MKNVTAKANKNRKHFFRKCMNRAKTEINKSIYLQLLFGVLFAIMFSAFMFIVLSTIFYKLKIFGRYHVDYDTPKYNMIDEFQDIIYKAKRQSDTNTCLQFCIHALSDNVYVTDSEGKVLYTGKENSEQSLISKQLDLDMLTKANSKLVVKDNGDFTYYEILYLDGQIYYVIQTKKLVPIYIYSKQWVNLISGIIAVNIFFVCILCMIRGKMKYIRYLSDSVSEISKGNLNYKVDVIGIDELSVVANNINTMETNLQKKIDVQNRQNKVYKELVTNMSHDLKTPLTVILGYLDIIRNHQCKTEEQKQEYLDISYAKAVSLQKMILNLFELVKNEKRDQKFNLQAVNLARLIKQYIVDYEFAAKDQGVTIVNHVKQEQLNLQLDVDQMTRVLNNIFENAIKYCTPGGTIDLSLCEEESTALIDISNSSEQIDSEDLERIFDKFYRCDKARNGMIEGNGIGLSTVKEIIEAMDGKVWAEYRDNQFHLKLRIRKNK